MFAEAHVVLLGFGSDFFDDTVIDQNCASDLPAKSLAGLRDHVGSASAESCALVVRGKFSSSARHSLT